MSKYPGPNDHAPGPHHLHPMRCQFHEVDGVKVCKGCGRGVEATVTAERENNGWACTQFDPKVMARLR